MHPARLTSAIPYIVFLFACGRGSSPGSPGPDPGERREAAMTAALRWIPSNAEYRGLRVVLMAGSAHGDFRPQWIDSLKSRAIIHHTCTALTVVDCPDSVRAAYVGLGQPDLAQDRSAELNLTVFVLNPARCGDDTTQSTEASGRLHVPWPGATITTYSWTPEKSVTARC